MYKQHITSELIAQELEITQLDAKPKAKKFFFEKHTNTSDETRQEYISTDSAKITNPEQQDLLLKSINKMVTWWHSMEIHNYQNVKEHSAKLHGWPFETSGGKKISLLHHVLSLPVLYIDSWSKFKRSVQNSYALRNIVDNSTLNAQLSFDHMASQNKSKFKYFAKCSTYRNIKEFGYHLKQIIQKLSDKEDYIFKPEYTVFILDINNMKTKPGIIETRSGDLDVISKYIFDLEYDQKHIVIFWNISAIDMQRKQKSVSFK